MDVATVRALAEDIGYEESFHSASEGILIFETADGDAFVSIWYHSGTVGVSLPHPRREKITSFFFNVDGRKLTEILSHPWHNEALHYVGLDALQTQKVPEIESEEAALRLQLSLLEAEEVDIEKEKATIQKRLRELPRSTKRTDPVLSELEKKKRELAEEIKFLEKQKTISEAELQNILIQKRQDGLPSKSIVPTSKRASSASASINESSDAKDRAESSEEEDEESPASSHYEFKSAKSAFLNRSISSVQRDSPGRYKGNRCLYSFSNDEYQEEFAKAWGEKSVGLVALSRGYIIIYDDGGVAWWDIPLALDQKFRDEDIRLPPIKFAALGPEDHYFVKFVNGKMEWVAKDLFQQAMRHGIEDKGLYVDRVSLGPGGSWIILWNNGKAEHDGLPPDLAAIVDQANQNGPHVREINLGPGGEWFAIFTDNSVQANNLGDSLHKALATVKKDGGRVRSIVFGEMNSWYVRYWDGNT